MKANQELRARLIDRVVDTWESLGEAWPYHADPKTERWETIEGGDWCAGHWIDAIRIAAQDRDRRDMLDDALRRTAEIAPWRVNDDMFRAPMYYYSAARLAETGGVEELREFALEVAEDMLAMAIPANGAMRTGTQVRVAGLAPLGDNVVAVDNVHPNLLLHWYALRTTGDRRFEEGARRNLDTIARDFIRNDGSTIEFIEYDGGTGLPRRHFTLLGDHDDSCWSRGQAWAIGGYLRGYEELGDPRYLDISAKLLDYWLANCADGTIPPWDFKVADPGRDEPLDTSAAAIVAESLARLQVRPDRREAAAGVLEHLPLFLDDLARHTTERGALVNGCFNNVKGFAERHELVWGDYFLLAALEWLDKGSAPC